MKAKDVRGFMIDMTTDGDYSPSYRRGRNTAISQQGEREIKHNKMALMKAIACCPLTFPNLLLGNGIEELADAIIAALPELLESGDATDTTRS